MLATPLSVVVNGLSTPVGIIQSRENDTAVDFSIQDDVTEYALHATRQMGALSMKIEKTTHDRGNQYMGVANTKARYLPKTKTEILEEAGIDIRRANEAEKLAEVPEDEFAEIVAKEKAGGTLTKSAVMKKAGGKP